MVLLPQHKEDFAERMCRDLLPLPRRRLPLDCSGDDSAGGADGGGDCGRARLGRGRLESSTV